MSITQGVPCGGYLIGFNLVCECVRTYVYGEGKGE